MTSATLHSASRSGPVTYNLPQHRSLVSVPWVHITPGGDGPCAYHPALGKAHSFATENLC